jgi:hypothetical protein
MLKQLPQPVRYPYLGCRENQALQAHTTEASSEAADGFFGSTLAMASYEVCKMIFYHFTSCYNLENVGPENILAAGLKAMPVDDWPKKFLATLIAAFG